MRLTRIKTFRDEREEEFPTNFFMNNWIFSLSGNFDKVSTSEKVSKSSSYSHSKAMALGIKVDGPLTSSTTHLIAIKGSDGEKYKVIIRYINLIIGSKTTSAAYCAAKYEIFINF
jgi:hypothetical protein